MWKFKEIEPGIPERNPHEAEFFRLTDPVSAVIREFIQNALDARAPDTNEVHVRVCIGTEDSEELSRFFSRLTEHLSAPEIRTLGIPDGIPPSIPYLTLEDFGTTGLDGDTGWAADSNFAKFWHGEGTSLKSGHHAGRWGLGKTTFHLASKIRSFWGVTVRIDDRKQLLMGKALLRTHRVGNSLYNYAGYYVKDEWKPEDDPHTIDTFKKCFGIARNNTETGFSIVIPLPDEEITRDNVVRAVIRHYFYAILAGILTVKIAVFPSHNALLTLDRGNLISTALSLNWNGTDWEGVDIKEMLNFVQSSIQNTDLLELNIRNSSNPEITEDSFDNLEDMRTRFRQGEICSFRIPVTVQLKDKPESPSFYSIHVRKMPALKKALEFYVRSGILITEIKTLGNRPIIALFTAEEEPVTQFLGDCETPAHTNWNERTEGFKEKYHNATKILGFIKNSVRKIVSILDEPPRERQVDFLKEIFSIPVVLEEIEEEEGETGKRPKPPFERKEPLFIVSRISGGFTITLNPERDAASFPLHAIVKIAYDTRRGNPFSQYEVFDFDLGSENILIQSQDCDIVKAEKNEMEITVTGPAFSLRVQGFDPNRDLVIDIKEK